MDLDLNVNEWQDQSIEMDAKIFKNSAPMTVMQINSRNPQ